MIKNISIIVLICTNIFFAALSTIRANEIARGKSELIAYLNLAEQHRIHTEKMEVRLVKQIGLTEEISKTARLEAEKAIRTQEMLKKCQRK